MKRKLKPLMYNMLDHIKDCKMDYKYAKEMKELGDSGLADYFISSAKNHLEQGKKGLDKFDYVLREGESEALREGKEKATVIEKMEAWHCMADMLEEKMKEMLKEISEF